MQVDSDDNVQTACEPNWTPQQGTTVPSSVPREEGRRVPPRLNWTTLQTMSVDLPSTPNTPTSPDFPTAHLPPPPAQTSTMDDEAYFPTTTTQSRHTLVSHEDIKRYLTAKLIEMKKEPGDEEALQKICFDLIRECRLTWEVYKVFESRLPISSSFGLITNIVIEQFKPKSFSRIKWKDVAPTIRNLPPTQPNTYLRIPEFALRRARMPWDMFEQLVRELDRSIVRVGRQAQLQNEAGVHDYIRPVTPLHCRPDSSLSLPSPPLPQGVLSG
jgi:hypothetical protein